MLPLKGGFLGRVICKRAKQNGAVDSMLVIWRLETICATNDVSHKTYPISSRLEGDTCWPVNLSNPWTKNGDKIGILSTISSVQSVLDFWKNLQKYFCWSSRIFIFFILFSESLFSPKWNFKLQWVFHVNSKCPHWNKVAQNHFSNATFVLHHLKAIICTGAITCRSEIAILTEQFLKGIWDVKVDPSEIAM